MTDTPTTTDQATSDDDPADDDGPTGTRPMLTMTAAAKATDRSRRTIGRMLDAGELPNATRSADDSWSIPVEDLLAAGLTLHASTPDPEPTPAAPSSDVAALRAEVTEWRHRAETAELIASERAAALTDVRQALDLAQRMLTTGAAPTPPTPTPMPPAPAPAGPAPTEAAPPKRRRWWNR